jgi:hypothetical protein
MAKGRWRRKARPAPERPEARSSKAPQQEEPAADRWRPWLLGGLVALFVLRPLFPSESAAREGDGLVVVMLWIALAVFWLLGAIGRRQFHVRFGWTDGAVLLLVGWHTIAALWVTTHGSPRPAINMLWEWVAYGLCFLLARQLIVTRREARAVIGVMVALAVGLAAYGLYEYYWELPATLAEFLDNPEAAMRKAEVWYEPGSRDFELFLARLDTYEPMATFGLTNSLAGFLAPWLVVTAGIGVGAGPWRRQWPTWLAVGACALPVAVCLLLTHSRTGCVAAALGLLLLVAAFLPRWMPRLGWKLPAGLAAAAAILVAVVVVLGVANRRVSSAAAKSLGYRVQYWQSTARMIADRPVAGCGPGNFQDTYTRYMLPEASEEIAEPHNFLMEVWATAGTPAMLALLGVLGGFAYALFRQGGGGPGSGEASTGPACIHEGQADGTPQVIGGAACGVLLSVPIGLMSAAPPGIAVLAVGLPLASVAVILLWRWIDAGPLSVILPAVGVVVLLVNLLAAGALGFPGVAGTLWLLVALGLNLTDKAHPHVLPRAAAVAGLGLVMALLFACWASGFNPVVRSQTAMHLALWEPARAEQHLKDAAAADPLSAEPWRHLALGAFDRWLKHPSEEALDNFEACVKTARDLAPNSATTWQMCGERYWRAFLETGRSDMLQEAVSAYGRAVDLYPNSPVNRANLAIALRAAGDQSGFQSQATRALHLDEQTPHSDKKLDDAVRDELRRGLSRSSSQAGQRGILGRNGADSSPSSQTK